jgi:hypothetical protein
VYPSRCSGTRRVSPKNRIRRLLCGQLSGFIRGRLRFRGTLFLSAGSGARCLRCGAAIGAHPAAPTRLCGGSTTLSIKSRVLHGLYAWHGYFAVPPCTGFLRGAGAGFPLRGRQIVAASPS